MFQISITFGTTQNKIDALDTIATSLHVDREEVLREALDAYLAWDEEFRASVEEGVRQFERGEVTSHEEVVRRFEAWQAAAIKSDV